MDELIQFVKDITDDFEEQGKLASQKEQNSLGEAVWHHNGMWHGLESASRILHQKLVDFQNRLKNTDPEKNEEFYLEYNGLWHNKGFSFNEWLNRLDLTGVPDDYVVHFKLGGGDKSES